MAETKVIPKAFAFDPKDFTVKELLASNPVPDDIDPFTRTLLGGCDPMAAHQVVTLVEPILAFHGVNGRVLYNDTMLRWVGGQSWQMGGSGCGKSVVLRALEDLFMSKERAENKANAMKVAAYTMLSEKERKETPMPQVKVHIFDSIPTALALLEQMQINGDEAIYISCTECGEFGKKISASSYNIILDMMKKSYDGTGEPYIHKNKDVTYYTPSMKLCCNIGGTANPMYRIMRYANADGTLSRGNLTILPERKDEKTEGPYKSPEWTMEERCFLRECVDRLKTYNNKFYENEKIEDSDECAALLEKYGLREEGADIPTVQDLEDCVQRERRARAVCLPEILELGRDIKTYLASLGDVAADCCSRADERAMGLCYLLLIANGFAPLRRGGGDEVHSGEERTPEDCELLRQCTNVARWWIMIAIDCALAVQTCLDQNTRSMKGGILAAFGEAAQRRVGDEVHEIRAAAFRAFEEHHAGEEVSVFDLREEMAFARLSRATLYNLVGKRKWTPVKRGLYLMPGKKKEAAS